MGESRERFVECAEMLLEGLERGWCEYDGKFVKQPRAAIRPEPFKSFRDRTYAAAVSPESSQIMARLGVGILIIPQKPWKEVENELNAYRKVFHEVNGTDAPPPISAGWVFCDEDKDRAYEKAREYIGGYWQTVLDHYQFAGDHLKTTKGYEYYGKMSEKIQQYGADGAIDFFMNLAGLGARRRCAWRRSSTFPTAPARDSFVGVFSYAGMPHEEAKRNMTLFAEKVMPELKNLPTAAERARKAA